MKRTREYGFTLIELIIVLSIASILLSMAVPNYSAFVQDSLLTAQSNNFASALALTKSEAIKRSNRVTICPSTDGTSCTGGSVWSNGWVVFVNPNGDGSIDAGEEILQVGSALSGGNTLAGARTRITFASNGFAMGFSDGFSLCDRRGINYSKKIILNNQGRTRFETGTGACS